MTLVIPQPKQRVQKSLMPKGVDHLVSVSIEHERALVQKSLMPKGVDHNVGLNRHVVAHKCKNL